MDQDIVKSVTNWPVPTTVKELQHFLDFTNLYQHFIQDFSIIASPLTALLKKQAKWLQWNPSADQGFAHLKEVFTTAPILKHLDPSKPFIMEVHASKTSVKAVLSLQLEEEPRFHPVAFFSKKLFPTERNYDIGNR